MGAQHYHDWRALWGAFGIGAGPVLTRWGAHSAGAGTVRQACVLRPLGGGNADWPPDVDWLDYAVRKQDGRIRGSPRFHPDPDRRRGPLMDHWWTDTGPVSRWGSRFARALGSVRWPVPLGPATSWGAVQRTSRPGPPPLCSRPHRRRHRSARVLTAAAAAGPARLRGCAAAPSPPRSLPPAPPRPRSPPPRRGPTHRTTSRPHSLPQSFIDPHPVGRHGHRGRCVLCAGAPARGAPAGAPVAGRGRGLVQPGGTPPWRRNGAVAAEMWLFVTPLRLRR